MMASYIKNALFFTMQDNFALAKPQAKQIFGEIHSDSEMIDAVKEYLAPKRFGVVAYVCLIVHFLCGLTLTAVTSALRASEIGKFTCTVDKETTTAYKAFVEKTCYSRYDQTHNSPLPLYGFVLLSIGFTVLVSVIYSLGVSTRIDEIDRTSNGSDEPRTEGEETNHGFYVFYFYFFHLVARSLFGILFTALQYTVFYPSGFDFKFSCSPPTSDITLQVGKNTSIGQLNSTSITCENSTASEKELWGVIVSVLNTVFALIIFGEVIYHCRRFPILNCRSEVGWRSDSEFVTIYLLRKRYREIELSIPSPPDCSIPENNTADCVCSTPDNNTADCSTPDNNTADCSLQECIDFYKQKILNSPRTPDIYYAPKAGVDDLYIDVVIHTGRAQHKFSKQMERHEIFDVYMQVPKYSICLKEIKDLFYPNKDTIWEGLFHSKKDTKDNFPRFILMVGRPGIGKTVLTEKIMLDWANGIDEFYYDKIVFLFKFRWFNIIDQFKNISLKTFLRYGTGLSKEKYANIFEEISKEPKKAIFIFDGLDEFDGDLVKCLDQSRGLLNDLNASMSGMNLFIKLASGNMLKGATILVTSRPTAANFYSRLNFDRTVEIIGFTFNKIEEYVSRFCDNTERNDLKPKIWNHIKSSSDLLNLCYIPVNCFIVCVTLSGCLSDPRNDTGNLPTTLTELYKTAIDHFAAHHNRNLDETSSEQTLKKLQKLAFHGIKNRQLVFNKQLFDEQMKKFGLVNSLSNPIFPVQTQFCFIHLTIQEFLAARHVTETLSPDEIDKFISANIESAKWYLVFQFIAGLLGEKIKMSGSAYHECVFTLAKHLTIDNGEIRLTDVKELTVIKCLREVDDKDIVEKVCEKSDLNLVTRISAYRRGISVSTSEWAAVTFVSKHLKNLKDLEFGYKTIREDNYLLIVELLQQRCSAKVMLADTTNIRLVKEQRAWWFDLVDRRYFVSDLAKEQLISAVMKSKCTLNHEQCTKLSHLYVSLGITDACVSIISAAIKDGHASHLQVLNLSDNDISDEGVGMLCNALIQGHCDLTQLVLNNCSLTANCINSLCKVLCDEHCNLTYLSLAGNTIGDEGVRMLCTNALRRDQCKLTKLSLTCCSLTDECVPLLCETLQAGKCRLTELSIGTNRFIEDGKSLLRDVKNTESCKDRDLEITIW